MLLRGVILRSRSRINCAPTSRQCRRTRRQADHAPGRYALHKYLVQRPAGMPLGCPMLMRSLSPRSCERSAKAWLSCCFGDRSFAADPGANAHQLRGNAEEEKLDHAAVRYALHNIPCSATAGMSVGGPMSVRASMAAHVHEQPRNFVRSVFKQKLVALMLLREVIVRSSSRINCAPTSRQCRRIGKASLTTQQCGMRCTTFRAAPRLVCPWVVRCRSGLPRPL